MSQKEAAPYRSHRKWVSLFPAIKVGSFLVPYCNNDLCKNLPRHRRSKRLVIQFIKVWCRRLADFHGVVNFLFDVSCIGYCFHLERLQREGRGRLLIHERGFLGANQKSLCYYFRFILWGIHGFFCWS